MNADEKLRLAQKKVSSDEEGVSEIASRMLSKIARLGRQPIANKDRRRNKGEREEDEGEGEEFCPSARERREQARSLRPEDMRYERFLSDKTDRAYGSSERNPASLCPASLPYLLLRILYP